MATTLTVHWMCDKHTQQVLTIERASFEHPWDAQELHSCLQMDDIRAMVGVNDRSEVIGYIVYELHNDHIRLVNLAVHPAYRNVGVGRQLLNAVIDQLHPNRRSYIRELVRESNLSAQKFYNQCGFIAVGVIPQTFWDTREDAYELVFRYGWPTEK